MNTPGAGTTQVNVIVLNWNGKDDTLRCLESLARLTYADVDVTVVDNGSTDDSVAAIRSAHPEVQIICTGENLGYAGGNNVGLRAALESGRPRYVLVLNNDTEVDPALVDRLVQAAQTTPSLTVFGPLIQCGEGPRKVWFAGAYWKPERLRFEHPHFRKAFDDFGVEPFETDYMTGCALFMSLDTLAKVGLLDERFFLIYEEVDWCYRLRRLGGHCLVVPAARLWHRVSASFGSEDALPVHYFAQRNELLWAEKALNVRLWLRMLVEAVATTLLPELRSEHPLPASILKRIYWSLVSPSAWQRSRYTEQAYRARVAGFRDYIMRRFGDCPDHWRRPT